MAKILIEGFNVFHSGHLYLVYVDDLGREWVLRGGPENDMVPWGSILVVGSVGNDTLLSRSEDARVDGNDQPVSKEERGSREIDVPDGMSVESAWNLMREYASAIQFADVPYDASAAIYGFNSNSFIGTLLSVIGVDVNDFIPQIWQISEFVGKDDIIDVPSVIEGSDETDIVYLNGSDDVVELGAGDDTVHAGDGSDQIIAGAGNDFFNGDALDRVDAVSIDKLSYAGASSGVTVDLSAATQQEVQAGIVVVTNDGSGGVDRFQNIEVAILTSKDDSFVFSDSIFHSGVRKLKIVGGESHGMGDVADFSQSAGGVEALSGQLITPLAEFEEEEFEGIETLENAPILWLTGFEAVIGSQGADEIQMGDTLWFAHGGGGADFLTGFVEDEDLLQLGYNGIHDQVIMGGDGDDVVAAGELSERLVGHDADVDLAQSEIQLTLSSQNDGFDILSYERSTAAVSVELQNQANVSAIVSGGYAEGDEAYGFDGVVGSAYNDDLKGNSNGNYLVGGKGHDYIWGYAGDDTIVAGSGHNHVWTGTGQDLIRIDDFDGTAEVTTVFDFTLISDHIDIDRSRIASYHFQNTYTVEGLDGLFIRPGLASLTLNDGGVISLNIVDVASGFEDMHIHDWSIFA